MTAAFFFRTLGTITAIAVCVSTAAGAKATASTPAFDSLLACRDLPDRTARLTCLDRAVAALAQARADGDLIVLDREQRRVARRQAFGLSLPALTILDAGDAKADRISAGVTEAVRGADLAWRIRLDGGALWRQIDESDPYIRPHRGSIAVVRRGALGSYFMKVDDGASMRVHREN